MTRALLLLGLLSGGCLIVPTKKISTKPGANETGNSTYVATHRIELSSRTDENTVHVHAIRHGECTRPVFAVTEVTTEQKAKLSGTEDPRRAVFGLILAPVLIPISAIVTGLALAADDPVTSKQTKLLGTEHYACSQEAEQLAVEVTFPTGMVVRSVTDARGDAAFEVPTTEPYAGTVNLAAQGAEGKQVSYSVPRPAISVTRDAVSECATKRGIKGAIELKLQINHKGHPTRLWLSVGDMALNECVSKRIAGQRFPQKMWEHTIKMPLTIAAAASASL